LRQVQVEKLLHQILKIYKAIKNVCFLHYI
jgi:hypothetical protein